MNVPLNDAIGLRIYRELMHRESNCSATWQLNFGKEALSKAPPPETMINLGKFSKFSAVPMPLAMQLEAIKKEGRVQAAEVDRYEKRVYPSKSDLPISERARQPPHSDALRLFYTAAPADRPRPPSTRARRQSQSSTTAMLPSTRSRRRLRARHQPTCAIHPLEHGRDSPVQTPRPRLGRPQCSSETRRRDRAGTCPRPHRAWPSLLARSPPRGSTWSPGGRHSPLARPGRHPSPLRER